MGARADAASESVGHAGRQCARRARRMPRVSHRSAYEAWRREGRGDGEENHEKGLRHNRDSSLNFSATANRLTISFFLTPLCLLLSLPQTCVPLFDLIVAWLRSGSLSDPYGEFFITSRAPSGSGGDQQQLSAEHMWSDRFVLRRSMVPSFFSDRLVYRIMATGKAVNFIRTNCKDAKFTLPFTVDYQQRQSTHACCSSSRRTQTNKQSKRQ